MRFSNFPRFWKNSSALGSFNCIFENNSLKALFGQNMKKLKILKLAPDFRYLQKVALKCLNWPFFHIFSMFPAKKEPNPLPPPRGRSWEKNKSSRAPRWGVFRENSKWWTKIHTPLTWVSRVKKVIQQFYWLITFFGFNWGQSHLATLVYAAKLRKNAQKSYLCCTIFIF